MRSCPVLLAFLQVELAIGQVREEIQDGDKSLKPLVEGGGQTRESHT